MTPKRPNSAKGSRRWNRIGSPARGRIASGASKKRMLRWKLLQRPEA